MSLAARLLGREVLTLDEFADAVAERLAWDDAALVVTRTRPGLLAAARGAGRAAEFPVQSAYHTYLKDTRTLQAVVARVAAWVVAATPRA